jgi:endonuclease-3 related protein
VQINNRKYKKLATRQIIGLSMDKNEILVRTYSKLLSEYGEQGWWPLKGGYSPAFRKRRKTPAEKFEISVGAILTQNTAWKNVEKALLNLREARALNRKRMEKMTEGEVAALIKPAGYYNLKARKLKEFLKYSGPIERNSMLKIWGCGPETIDSILLYAYDRPVFVVDAYTKRIFSRVGLCAEKAEYGKVQELFHKNLEKDAEIFNEYHALLVEHAKRHCRKTPVCAGCSIIKLCKKRKAKAKRGR